MPRPPNGRICRSCAPRFRYSENNLMGSAGRGEHPKGALPLLLLRLDESAQHGVDARLIPASALLEPMENVLVEPQGHGLLALREDNPRPGPFFLGPWRIVRILGGVPLDLLLGHRIDAGPVSEILHLPGLLQRYPRDTLFAHFALPHVPVPIINPCANTARGSSIV